MAAHASHGSTHLPWLICGTHGAAKHVSIGTADIAKKTRCSPEPSTCSHALRHRGRGSSYEVSARLPRASLLRDAGRDCVEHQRTRDLCADSHFQPAVTVRRLASRALVSLACELGRAH